MGGDLAQHAEQDHRPERGSFTLCKTSSLLCGRGHGRPDTASEASADSAQTGLLVARSTQRRRCPHGSPMCTHRHTQGGRRHTLEVWTRSALWTCSRHRHGRGPPALHTAVALEPWQVLGHPPREWESEGENGRTPQAGSRSPQLCAEQASGTHSSAGFRSLRPQGRRAGGAPGDLLSPVSETQNATAVSNISKLKHQGSLRRSREPWV